jgi:hypothetical protein
VSRGSFAVSSFCNIDTARLSRAALEAAGERVEEVDLDILLSDSG